MLGATFGTQDITHAARRKQRGTSLTLQPSIDVWGDLNPGLRKTLTAVVSLRGAIQVHTSVEGGHAIVIQ